MRGETGSGLLPCFASHDGSDSNSLSQLRTRLLHSVSGISPKSRGETCAILPRSGSGMASSLLQQKAHKPFCSASNARAISSEQACFMSSKVAVGVDFRYALTPSGAGPLATVFNDFGPPPQEWEEARSLSRLPDRFREARPRARTAFCERL